MDPRQFLYRFDGYLLLQESLDPVGCPVRDPRTGISERDILAEGFAALLAPLSVYEKTALVCLGSP